MPSRAPQPPPLGIFFVYWNLILKLKVKDRKARNFISSHLIKRNVSLKTHTNILSFFVSDLKYQMKVLQVELHQSYSWSQDRRSMDYSEENHIANWLIATGEEKNSSLIKISSWTQNLVIVSSFNFKEKNLSAEFWPMQSSIGNVPHYICHVTCPDKWHVKYNVL